jgi:hypothetical protein
MKQFRGWRILAVVVGVLGLAVITVPGRDMRLEHRGKWVSECMEPIGGWIWLNGHSILVYGPDPQGGPTTVARSIDTRTGRRTTLPIRLTSTPYSMSASPDGSTVVWDEIRGHDTYVHIDHVDGTRHLVVKSAEASPNHVAYDYFWMADGSCFARLTGVYPTEGVKGTPTLIVRKLSDPNAATVVRLSAAGKHWFDSFAFRSWDDLRGAEVDLNAPPIHASTWQLSLHKPDHPGIKYPARVPGRLSMGMWLGGLSPDGTRLVSVVDRVTRPPAIVEMLQRIHHIPWPTGRMRVLWVCSITGKDGHEAAHMDLPSPGTVGDGLVEIMDVRWSPDGRQVGCMTTGGLYVVSAD